MRARRKKELFGQKNIAKSGEDASAFSFFFRVREKTTGLRRKTAKKTLSLVPSFDSICAFFALDCIWTFALAQLTEKTS